MSDYRVVCEALEAVRAYVDEGVRADHAGKYLPTVVLDASALATRRDGDGTGLVPAIVPYRIRLDGRRSVPRFSELDGASAPADDAGAAIDVHFLFLTLGGEGDGLRACEMVAWCAQRLAAAPVFDAARLGRSDDAEAHVLYDDLSLDMILRLFQGFGGRFAPCASYVLRLKTGTGAAASSAPAMPTATRAPAP
ncbi:MAG TPA: Pvc16 family protein [Planctomycetota bacterium]|nr:Pvc16 family protein [Planctomycetota bacterium]